MLLQPSPESPAAARAFCDSVLAMWGYDGDVEVTDAARTIVSELVTNAVVHARTAVDVSVYRRGERVRIEVTDTCLDPIRPRGCTPDGVAGRGLMLVDGMSEHWGVVELGDGKVVWAELPTPDLS
jgi:anti-sigma regulatory factor (Ser/Thr protein kinase)